MRKKRVGWVLMLIAGMILAPHISDGADPAEWLAKYGMFMVGIFLMNVGFYLKDYGE